MTTKMEQRITQITVLPEKEPIFSALATLVSIENEGGGDFITIAQSNKNGYTGINIDVHEWEAIKEAVDKLIKDCRG